MKVFKSLSSPSSAAAVNVWGRLLQKLAVSPPAVNRFVPKIKAGQLLLEVGQPPEWKPFEVVLAGESAADVGLYYYPHKDAVTPMGCIRLQSAHIDSLEEVLMVVTKDKTWFLCASHARDASDWSDAIDAAIERISHDGTNKPTLHRLSSSVSASTLSELQSRGVRARVNEFLDVFVRSTREDMCFQAAKGALSWSCMRSLTWKVWLDYIPGDVPFKDWVDIARQKRQDYEKERRKHKLFKDLLVGQQIPDKFLTMCETSTDSLLYSIYKDVRRTRGDMPFFRDPGVQCLMIRVLYIYSVAHPEISYNQGMGELLATLVYLLHVEQWPTEEDDTDDICAGEDHAKSAGRSRNVHFFPNISPTKEQAEDTSTEEEDPSFVYIESFVNIHNDDSYLDGDTFLRLAPFAGGSGKYHECCRNAASEIVRELTASDCVEHDSYLLLEEMMLRMAGTYCPHVPVLRRNSKVEKPLSLADQLPVSPLDDQMNRIHHHILSRCDPPTARHLVNLGVEPQIFLLRWVRVLMAREFETPQVWQIWDAIFSLTPSDFSFINMLCVAVVREFRVEILATEDPTIVLLSLRDISGRIKPARLVDNARELYDALLIAAGVEASMESARSPC